MNSQANPYRPQVKSPDERDMARIARAAGSVVGELLAMEAARGAPFKETYTSSSTGKPGDNRVFISVRSLRELQAATEACCYGRADR